MQLQRLFFLQAATGAISLCPMRAQLSDWMARFRVPFEWIATPSAANVQGSGRGEGAAIVVHCATAAEARAAGLRIMAEHPQARVVALSCEPAAEGMPEEENALRFVCCAARSAAVSVLAWLMPEFACGRDVELLPGIVGCSSPLRSAAAQAPLLAESDATCLLLGETGTGKELFARALHYLSPRRHSPFVPLNCGAVGEQLFENELFGHMPGAYTDARSQQSGLLAYAEGGTLFLDEVDALSPSAQVKLLRVLQEREYRPLGSTRVVRTNVRILAASNSDLAQMVRERRLREDLYHRLNVLRLVIPPLRERVADIPLLAHRIVAEYSQRRGMPPMRLTSAATDRLAAHRWPGNVRELQGVLQRAVLLNCGPTLDAHCFDLADEPAANDAAPTAGGRAQTLKAAKDVAIMQFERNYLSDLLHRCGGNVSRAARVAGKERRSFQRLLRKHNFVPANFSTRPVV